MLTVNARAQDQEATSDGEAYQLSGILSLIDAALVQSDLINSLKEMVQVETDTIAPAFYVC